MATPKTVLYTAPYDVSVDRAFGRMIPSRDLVAGLREINPRIRVWEQYSPHVWYPGKRLAADLQTPVQRSAIRAEGITSLWLGNEPGGQGAIKITSLTPGPVPEWTQIGPFGDIIAKGWRAIFEKVIGCRAATRHQIERKFRVSLAVSGTERRLCKQCLRESGARRPANGGAAILCDWHDGATQAARRTIRQRRN